MFGRIIRSVNYRIVLWAVVAALFCIVLTSPRLMDPILNFCFGGVVPGTDHVLAPDVIILGVTIIVGLLAVALLTLWLLRIIRVRRAGTLLAVGTPENREHVIFSRDTDTSHLMAPTTSNIAPKLARAAVATRRVTTTKIAEAQSASVASKRHSLLLSKPVLRVTSCLFMAAYAAILGSAALAVATITALRALGRAGVTTAHYTGWTVRVAASGFGRFIVASARTTSAICMKLLVVAIIIGEVLVVQARSAARKLWIWLEPRAAKLDTWLELQCRAFVKFASRKLGRHEGVTVVKSIIRETKNNLRGRYGR